MSTSEKPRSLCRTCKDYYHSKNDILAIQNTKMCTVCVAETAVKGAIINTCPDCLRIWRDCICNIHKNGR